MFSNVVAASDHPNLAFQNYLQMQALKLPFYIFRSSPFVSLFPCRFPVSIQLLACGRFILPTNICYLFQIRICWTNYLVTQSALILLFLELGSVNAWGVPGTSTTTSVVVIITIFVFHRNFVFNVGCSSDIPYYLSWKWHLVSNLDESVKKITYLLQACLFPSNLCSVKAGT